MFGFFIGLVSLFGLVHVLRGGHRGHFGGGCGHRSHHRHGGFRRGGRWRNRWLRGLFERLDTTPGQEKAIREAIGDVLDEARSARRAGSDTRSNLGVAFAAETLDDSAIESAMAPADETLARMRVATSEALKRIHEVLDDEQRQRLARWLSRGDHGPLPFGPYR
jgi:Spy/CpxP family protein refolding chaperone